MKKFLVLFLVSVLTVFQAHAVLKEKDLAQTLGVLRAELERSYNQQTIQMSRFERTNREQHTNLIRMMQKSNQIALMLYSQNSDFTFDMTYACQEATEQYRTLHTHHLPYAKIKERLTSEIVRYNELIQALLDLPPRLQPNGELAEMPDSLKEKFPKLILDTSKLSLFMLDEQGLADREACLKYAQAIRDNYQKLLENVILDEEHYNHVTKRVKELNDYAMERYAAIQQNIFVNGDNNYFTTLKRFKMQLMLARKDVDDKYRPLRKASEWRGPVIGGICIFVLSYLIIASLLSFAIVRWLLPKRVRARFSDKKKLTIINVAAGVAIFAISIMVARFFVKQNFIVMAIDLLITFAWLMEVILLSLLIRLNENQIMPGIRAYIPFLTMALMVIIFRIILIPNNVVNLIYPPILLLFTIWQLVVLKRRLGHLPDSDMIYTVISLVAMVVSCVASWVGYVLLAVQIMIWWTIQLAAIQTITCFYDLARMYEVRFLLHKILPEKAQGKTLQERKNMYKSLQPKLIKGDYIAQTWLYDFVYRALIPMVAVLSVPASIYFAAGIFEMSSACVNVFFYTFLNKPGVIQLSLFKLCLVLELFFFFKYLNYMLRAFFLFLKKRRQKDPNGPSNITLGNNVISILVWGVFAIASFIILQVPSSGISIVMAGLATGLGFAMKDLLENFVYGISLMTGRLRVGDYIECDGTEGKVESINYQSTQIVTLDGSVIAFQNTQLFSKNFQNRTRNHGYVRIKLPVGVAYGTDVRKVRDMLVDSLQSLVVKNESGKHVIDPKHGFSVLFDDFGESSVDLLVVCWVLVEERVAISGEIKELIYNTLNNNNIEIPFPQRDVYVRQMAVPSEKEKK